MKKNYIKSLLVLGIVASTFGGVSAVMVDINHSVPTAQGYKVLPTKSKTETSNFGAVTLSKKEPDAVTFSAKADGGSYASGTTVTQKGLIYDVKYAGIYGGGTPMTARFRNNNWSLNSNMITGVFDYR